MLMMMMMMMMREDVLGTPYILGQVTRVVQMTMMMREDLLETPYILGPGQLGCTHAGDYFCLLLLPGVQQSAEGERTSLGGATPGGDGHQTANGAECTRPAESATQAVYHERFEQEAGRHQRPCQ